MFCRYALRTTDVLAGRQFYAEAIGLELPDGSSPGSILEAWPLHERARAMGAPSHWLGHIAVDDAEARAEHFVARGGERLGPSVELDGGQRYATVRDPSGAVVALRQGSAPPLHRPVAWHQLHTRDAEAAMALYSDVGFAHTHTIETSEPAGGHRLFGLRADSEPVGAVANTARWHGVHPHWLFYFPVPDLDAAVARVRALGAKAFDPVEMPGRGVRIAACDDPQGAAFGLLGRI